MQVAAFVAAAEVVRGTPARVVLGVAAAELAAPAAPAELAELAVAVAARA